MAVRPALPEPERHGCPRPRPTGGAKLCLGRRCREHLLAARVRRAITNGGARDLREVEALDFHLFAPAPVVGHAHIRFVEIDTPVTVGSLVVHAGDLIHGDEHGVMVVPNEIPLDKLIPFVTEFLASEKTIVDCCQQPEFDIDKLCKIVDEHNERTTGHL